MQAKLAQAPSEHCNTESVAGWRRRGAERTRAGNRSRQRRGRADLLNLRERLAQMSPVERGPGVGLAARGNVDMADDIDDRISPAQNDEQLRQARVLSVGIGVLVGPFELHAHGKIVAALAPPPARGASVPGSLCAGRQLDQLALAAHQEVRRYLQIAKGFVVRMRGKIERI